MNTIKKPMGKLQQVTHLMNIATLLKLNPDWTVFDKLMSKYEKNYLMFDYLMETMELMIMSKRPIGETKEAFEIILDSSTLGEAYNKLMKIGVSNYNLIW